MKKLIVKKIDTNQNSITQLSQLLENNSELVNIDTINWNDYDYKPQISFRIAHTGDQILLKFYVTEINPKAVCTTINGDVYKDSCVEFFISPKADQNYYNFEFNCIGNPHVGYGPGRHNRQPINPQLLQQIQTESTLGSKPVDINGTPHSWEMMLVIPKETMSNDKIETLSGLQAKGNLYKCGDETAKMHFVTWNKVETQNPDYHQYPYFGDIIFE